MHKIFIPTFVLFILSLTDLSSQCEISAITATPLSCNSNYFNVSVNLEVSNPASPGFTLAGNGTIYGTFLYEDLPVTVGPLLGDNESEYEFIAWDVENPACQNYGVLTAIDCGPICHFSDAELNLIFCQNDDFATVELDFEAENTAQPTFDLFYENGSEVGTYFYTSLPVTLTSFQVNGSEPIVLTVCDANTSCCQTFEFDAIDCEPDNCEIYNVDANPHCIGGNFVVVLDFDYTLVASDSFTVQGNNLNYGTFGYNELPISLGPLNGGSLINWEFDIRDSELTSCVKEYVLGQYQCPPPCNFQSVEATASLCAEDNYSLIIDLEIEGEGDQGYSVLSETAYYGTYSYDDLPLTIPVYEGSGDFVDYVTICDNENPGCCETLGYEALLCAGCIIYNLNAVPQPCNDEQEIFVLIDFEFQNVGNQGFNISGNGEDYGNFSYEDEPILLGPFPGDGSQFLEFVVADNQDGFCFTATEIGLLGCDDICELSNLTADPQICTGNDQYSVQIDFDFENVTGVGFDLYANGEYYDSYGYDQIPLVLLEFPGNGGLDTITVCENDDPDCCATVVFEAPSCECSIFDVTAEYLACTSDSTFAVALEFYTENFPGDAVDVFIDGVFMGSFDANASPVTVDNIPEGDGTALLSICANDLNTCCEEIIIELASCDAPECVIWNVVAEPGNCTSDSSYILDIDFNAENLPVDSVIIYANDQYIGNFMVPSTFIHILNFPVYESGETEITVCAVGIIGCCSSFSFETPDCNPNDCEIWDLVADPGVCVTDSTYSLLIAYNSENIAGDSITITANGNDLGIFVDDDGQIMINEFPYFETDVTEITICSYLHPDCCDSYTFETPPCGGGNDCSVSGLFAEVGECQSDTTYVVEVHFDFDNLPVDSVLVSSNGGFIGQFHISEGQFFIEDFPVSESPLTSIEVCAVNAPDCCDIYEFQTPDCSGNTNCDLFNLEAQVGDCLTDSTYLLEVEFQFANLPTDSVSIIANGMLIGNFHVSEGHFTIEDFPAFQADTTELVICAVGAPDCCVTFNFGTPDCSGGGTCNIFDLFAEAGSCTSDSTFIVDIVFEHNNLPGDSVEVFANDILVGVFEVPLTFIHITNFPLYDIESTVIRVCAVGAPDCCDTYIINNPTCSGGCEIFDIDVDVQDCSSDSTFGAVITFDWENSSPNGFDIYTGDELLGSFGLDQLPANIENFPSNETGEYELTICENDNELCCTTIVFEGPVCGTPVCGIFDLTYSLTPCDKNGEFYFVLDFEYQNTGVEGFSVVGNSTNYGTFSYDSIPVQVGPFEMGSNTVFEFLVTDNEFSTCFDFIEPGIVDCIVGIEEVSFDDVFAILNNGTIPGIYAKKKISLTVYNSNGKLLINRHTMESGSLYELMNAPPGVYIALISSEGHTWAVSMVRS